MKKLFALLIGVVTINVALAQWYPLNPGTTGYLVSVCFPVPDTGYVLGYNDDLESILLKTTDGGNEWIPLGQLIDNELFTSVFFPDADTGYMLSVGGNIARTFDGGINWTSLYDFGFSGAQGQWIYTHSIYFSDTLHGFFVETVVTPRSNSGTIFCTNDGGLNWSESYNSNALGCLYFYDDSTGYVTGGKGKILKTTDAGVNWILQYSDPSKSFSSVHFVNENIGYAVGHGIILKTSDGGLNWVISKYCPDTSFSSVYSVDENKGYVVGDNGVILNTSDGGATWSAQNSGTIDDLTTVCFPGPETGYIIGVNGIILKTTNGGFPAGTDEHINNAGSLIIYPNPAVSLITIETSLNPGHLSILSLSGLPLLQHKITETMTILDISALPPGMYFLKLQDENRILTGKVIKQ